MRPHSAAALLMLTAWTPCRTSAGESASYSLTPSALDAGGGRGTPDGAPGPAPVVDSSAMAGGAGASEIYTLRSGFAGQLEEEATAFAAVLTTASLPETGSGRLQAGYQSPEGFLRPVPAAEVTWSILTGPVAGVAADGLVTAGTVYVTTPASVQAEHAGQRAVAAFQVTEFIPDNFGLYAGDRLPDGWQVRYFGPAAPDGGPQGDPDRDGYLTLLEFAFGTHPGDQASGSGTVRYADGVLAARGQPDTVITNIPGGVDFRVIFVRRRDHVSAGLRYHVQFSPDLQTWITTGAVPTVLAVDEDGEHEAVSVPWPLFADGRKIRFYRLLIDFTPVP